ncbi:MAG: hypothetical protein C0404_09940 [Verrucomicrobia bacterium]|nr:hypothetical protein [Verrucomicrobiota bacterium]
MSAAAASRPGFAFADGVLWINTPNAEMRIRWRPSPIAEERTSRGEWREFWPDFRLLEPAGAEGTPRRFTVDLCLPPEAQDLAGSKQAAFTAFRSELPDRFSQVTERFCCNQWALLRMMQRQKGVADLAQSNPVLAYCLANNHQFRNHPQHVAAIEGLFQSRKKQKEILAWLGFPGTEPMVRLMRKILPGAVSPSILRCLRNAINEDQRVLEMLTHLREVTAGVLDLVVDLRVLDFVTPRLLSEIAAAPEERLDARVASMLFDAYARLKMTDPQRHVRQFTNVGKISEFYRETAAEYAAHVARRTQIEQERQARAAEEQRLQREANRLRREENRRRREKLWAQQFPQPPIQGTDSIRPIANYGELVAEGNAQRNCVASYADRVLEGWTYIYSVRNMDERATLSIIRGGDGIWRCDELKRGGNRRVRRSTVNLVRQWLREGSQNKLFPRSIGN